MNAQSKSFINGNSQVVLISDDRTQCHIRFKDFISFGEGTECRINVPQKGIAQNQIACNVFRYLKKYGIEVAFIQETNRSKRVFLAEFCQMFPYKIILHKEACGSYLIRYPEVKPGKVFERLVEEFFLETSGKKWGEHKLPCDNPKIIFMPGYSEVRLYFPHQAVKEEEPFLILSEEEVLTHGDHEYNFLEEMMSNAENIFSLLEKEWQKQGVRLLSLQMQFGLNREGKLVLTSPITNDSWSIVNAYDVSLDKDGLLADSTNLSLTAEIILKIYQQVANMTSHFEKDD